MRGVKHGDNIKYMIWLIVLIVIVLNIFRLIWWFLIGRFPIDPNKEKDTKFYDEVTCKNVLLYIIVHMVMVPVALIYLILLAISSIFLCVYKLIKGEPLFPYL